MAPELIEAFVAEYKAEQRRAAKDTEGARLALDRAIAEAARKIAGILRAVEDGNYHPSLMERLSALEAEKA